MTITEIIKRPICRLFGHRIFTEMYAERILHNRKHRYNVTQEEICSRCGHRHHTVLAKNLSRAELLKNGWFIER